MYSSMILGCTSATSPQQGSTTTSLGHTAIPRLHDNFALGVNDHTSSYIVSIKLRTSQQRGHNLSWRNSSGKRRVLEQQRHGQLRQADNWCLGSGSVDDNWSHGRRRKGCHRDLQARAAAETETKRSRGKCSELQKSYSILRAEELRKRD